MQTTGTWVLRPLTMADVPSLLEWYNDEELHYIANSRAFVPYTLDELLTYWKKKLNREHAKFFVIEHNGVLIGRCGLNGSAQSRVEVEFSILIARRALFGKGMGTEITKHMLDVAFTDPDVKRVRLYVRRDNERALRCYVKCGYRSVHAFTQNGVPTVMMQVERDEWERSERL
ncbi:GNAT family N-acetyltransferase [Tumebacillus sp. ITR2]|uniref:GNAT family N-acetyltransferase n=1 Tax=Tumebacillus amylolyticus TaxID=2801339 RepID=A0ABS1JCG2_9BACL|nr:GNAT family N-acetyltransferase [Tumebacillus amylolyticus]MBL0387956.1 GNAT family N-acetyltransferase [Tumebacillus amylolyticus]